ncbi:MAG: hypothetical protein PHP42_06575 [Bacteroidota bacterium]|nr:hypothetical protein [Bacteroidota bacterium]
MTTSQQPHTVSFRYKFTFENGQEKQFGITLDDSTLELIPSSKTEPPDWTKLDFHPCDNCPLIGKVSHCPVAVNLALLVDEFRDVVSYEHAVIVVETLERTYSKDSTVQKGLSSIIGICMVTSNCPIMDELRPMTRFHLPFATTKETLFRAVSYYLTRQYFVMKDGKEPDWNLNQLIEIYKQVSIVNIGITRRVAQASQKDANVNAIVILHSYGDSVPYFIEDGLNEIKYLFKKFL